MTSDRDDAVPPPAILPKDLEGDGVLHVALDFSRYGMAVFDRDNKIVSWNWLGRAIFGFPDDVIYVGARYEDIVRWTAEQGLYGPGDVDELVTARMETIAHPEKPSQFRIRSQIDGRIFETRSVRTADGGLLVIHIDSTAQAELKARLEAENQALENRVLERTEELQRLNEALTSAKAMADAANLSKTRFLAAASHDLLQPLSAARLYTTSLREGILAGLSTEATLALAANVEAAHEALEHIVVTLLDISHLDRGATKRDEQTFLADDLLQQLKTEFDPLAEKKGLVLTLVRSSLAIRSDRNLLGRLLQNLISNAIKYTIDGRILVGLRRDGQRVRIEVRDTGIGIPENSQREIFVEFQRLPNATTLASGMGLGLAIVQRLGRLLDHDVTVRSTQGHGSVFSVSVPLAARSAVIDHRKDAAHARRSLDGLFVATIDNEPLILAGMRSLLEGWGCTVASATDQPGILAALRAHDNPPDVILADYHLGEHDGVALIGCLRAHYGQACPAALITADRSPLVRDIAYRSDILVLNKPLKAAALRALLSQWNLLGFPRGTRSANSTTLKL